MGNTSSFENSIANQESYVNKRMKDPDMQHLKHGFFRDGHEKYNNHQIKSYLRQEYNHTRKPNAYVLDNDLNESQKFKTP
ncbi:hypothetical protein [Legionella longbeachae]|uniref:Uncharacterized protein n=1 Tax=Legionella longbeachae serogroup 1 (strain NSW150) TaxID=661367 RepID=D3HJ00_LEGLN|nr:hypothetical protein [Legionella longbeachae]VEE02888.1 Uncharacterised protein [Legionella oakridgensis]HBD7398908.1 hypothetical protein [Legionella pneumophila]ARB90869.1 hypothetical protein A6J40_01075 [Legionella longbeachae]ARM32705.1 hypothetical protein B0B39_03870 [Legionella longbeachae]EEZ94515.1 conserved hypothetical protein [Legionella longbeachae D-4968]